MDLDIDAAPSLPRFQPQDQDAILAGRRPSMTEYLAATVAEGWWNTTPGVGSALARAERAGQEDPTPLTREEWQAEFGASRPRLAWDERMTRGRAAAMAATYDENKYRQGLMAARDPSAFETILGFGGMLAGSIPDPVNFLPIAGPLGRVLRGGEAALEAGIMARTMGRAAGALERPGVAGSIVRGAVDASVGNALAMPLVYGGQAQFGDEITASRVIADLAIGAVIGAGFGAAGGLLERAASRSMQVEPVAAARILDSAARDVAAGRPVEIPPELAARVVNDAVVRSAPPEVAPFLRRTEVDGTAHYEPDLPTRADGAPLTREEFEAELRRRQPAEAPRQEAAPAPRQEAPQPAEAPQPRLDGEAAPARQEAAPAGPEAVQRSPDMDAAYRWYAEAVAARQQAQRLAAEAPPLRQGETAQGAREPLTENRPAAGGKGAEADPETAAIRQELDQMRADGRLTAADEAILRAGDEAAAEGEAVAKGLAQAAVCMMGRAA